MGNLQASATVGSLAAPLLVMAESAAAGDAAAFAGSDVEGILGTLNGTYSQLLAGQQQATVAAESYANLEVTAKAVAGAATARLTDVSGNSSDVVGIRNIDISLGAGLSTLDAQAIGRADLTATSVDEAATATANTSTAGILGTAGSPLNISFAENGRIAAIASQTSFAEAISVQGDASTSLTDGSRGIENITITDNDQLQMNVTARSSLTGRAITVAGNASA
jgi:hypothetical protein